MPSPFPGVDPYVEASGRWPGFHNNLIAHCSELLNLQLPENYAALVDERVELVDLSRELPARQGRPDVAVVRDAEDISRSSGTGGGAIAEIAPTLVTLPEYEEISESYIVIVSLPSRELVTSVEILSPSNKNRSDGGDYLLKRIGLLRRQVNLVERAATAGT